MNEHIMNLTIEHDGSGTFLLEQDCGGNIDRVELHETQVRHIATLAGLLPRREEPYSPPASVLARRLRVLLERIDELDDMLVGVSRKSHEDVSYEMAFSMATWELATEFCADLPSANNPDSGAITGANPPNSGGIARSEHAQHGPGTTRASAAQRQLLPEDQPTST